MEEKILLFTEKQGWPRVVDEKSQRERERQRKGKRMILFN